MNYRVIFTERVIADISEKVDYLRAQHVSEQTIGRWFEGLLDRIETLYDMPRIYGLDHAASKQHGYSIHKLTYKKHIVRYRVDDDARRVYILSFIHGAARREA